MMSMLCVEPGEQYLDEYMEIWNPVDDFSPEECVICGKTGASGFRSEKTEAVVHSGCVNEVLPCQMFKAYKEHVSLSAILERFLTVFQAAETEFTKHMLDKGDSWLQLPTDNLFSMVHRVSAKLLLAETIDDCYDELIALLLSSAMLAQRYLLDQAQDDAELNGAIPF